MNMHNYKIGDEIGVKTLPECQSETFIGIITKKIEDISGNKIIVSSPEGSKYSFNETNSGWYYFGNNENNIK